MSAELLFHLPPATSGALLFGEDTLSTDISADVSGSFAALTASAIIRTVTQVAVLGSFGPLAFAGEASYDSNTDRPLVGQQAGVWQDAQPTQNGSHAGYQDSAKELVGWGNAWGFGTQTNAEVRHPLPKVLAKVSNFKTEAFSGGLPFAVGAQGSYEEALRLRSVALSKFQGATPTQSNASALHQDSLRVRREASDRFQQGAGLHRGVTGRSANGTQQPTQVRAWHQDGVPPPAGTSKPPVPPIRIPYVASTGLLFQWPVEAGAGLLFQPDPTPSVPEGTITVPVRRVYFVLNNVTLQRVSDNVRVPAFSLSLGLDVGSWSWSFDASLPGVAQALVEPTAAGNVELKANVNGTEFRVLAENVSRERVFGNTTLRVSGRGRNAVLDSPYSPQQTFGNTIARTSQQLIDDVMTFNGVSLGYGIDYGLEPWLVPAGVFSHQGTYISAVSELVKAGGGYLIPHPSDLSFKVRHKNPTAPWNSPTPNIVLPSAVVLRESLSFVEKPAYNRVYVRGQSQGVMGRVTRAGTAGDIPAPMVTDSLITATAAARQNGLAILADTGRQLQMDLSLPVLSETGIIMPGTYVQYDDGSSSRVGIVRRVQVNASSQVDVKQTIGTVFHV